MEDKIDYSGLKKRWNEIAQRVQYAAINCGRNPTEVNIIAVSKMHPPELIVEGIETGIMLFGENYAQELIDKKNYIDSKNLHQPEWHFIGHLQRNKVKYIIPFISTIHSVDSLSLAQEISKEAEKNNRTLDILLQANTSGEASKFGCEPGEMLKLFESVYQSKNVNIKGLMTIGSFSDNKDLIIKEFRLLRSLRDEINKIFNINLKHLSMGMTGDFELAIAEGATYVRIGTAIFGERNYSI